MPRDERPTQCHYCGAKKKSSSRVMCDGCWGEIVSKSTGRATAKRRRRKVAKRPTTKIEQALADRGIKFRRQ